MNVDTFLTLIILIRFREIQFINRTVILQRNIKLFSVVFYANWLFSQAKMFKIDIRQIFLAIFAHVSFPFVPKRSILLLIAGYLLTFEIKPKKFWL